ncbi:hypothetical protein B0H14DRAFT_3473303 [Mycena olivaceomarginata]|nr:hypothetical protein B0H14DRAFT_3473303 [Mycena olivaceomarginata]
MPQLSSLGPGKASHEAHTPHPSGPAPPPIKLATGGVLALTRAESRSCQLPFRRFCDAPLSSAMPSSSCDDCHRGGNVAADASRLYQIPAVNALGVPALRQRAIYSVAAQPSRPMPRARAKFLRLTLSELPPFAGVRFTPSGATVAADAPRSCQISAVDALGAPTSGGTVAADASRLCQIPAALVLVVVLRTAWKCENVKERRGASGDLTEDIAACYPPPVAVDQYASIVPCS